MVSEIIEGMPLILRSNTGWEKIRSLSGAGGSNCRALRWLNRCPSRIDHAEFDRSDYLRVLPPTDPDYPRVYGMRADTESLNAQFERAFYNRRLPAWGLHNQTVIVLMAALAQNAWARHT